MPAVHRRAGAHRRTINEINMVPFIDVMLVLLIIFMVSAPLITTGVVDLPAVGKARSGPERHVALTIEPDGAIRLRVAEGAPRTAPRAGTTTVAGGGDADRVTLATLAARVRDAQGGDDALPVVIAADKGVKYDLVVQVMDRLRQAGVQRVGLSVKSGGG